MSKRMDFQKIRARLSRKLRSVLFVLLGASAVTGMLLLFVPFLPGEWQDELEAAAAADWKESVRSLKLKILARGSDAERAAIFLAVQLAQVLAAPVPGQLMGLLGGYAFGFWRGLGLTMIGLTVGSLLAMGVGRLVGRAVVEKMVPANWMTRYEGVVTEGGAMSFFLIFLLPALPDDAVCFMAGLTRIPLWKLMLACVFGRLPGMAVLTYLGSAMETDFTAAMIVLAAGITLGILVWIFDEELLAVLRR